MRRLAPLLLLPLLACGSPPESPEPAAAPPAEAPTPASGGSGTVDMTPMFETMPTDGQILDLGPPKPRRRRVRPVPPFPAWGIMDLLVYRRCSVGDTGTVELVGSTAGRPALTIEDLDKPPFAKPVPGEGRHGDDKGVPLSVLFAPDTRVLATMCSGESTTIEPDEDWWLVKSTRGFVKGVRMDTRADLLRDITRLQPAKAK